MRVNRQKFMLSNTIMVAFTDLSPYLMVLMRKKFPHITTTVFCILNYRRTKTRNLVELRLSEETDHFIELKLHVSTIKRKGTPPSMDLQSTWVEVFLYV